MNSNQYGELERHARRWHRRGSWSRWDEEDAVHEMILVAMRYGNRFDPDRGEWGGFVARWLTSRLMEEYVRQSGGRWVRDEHGRRGVRYPDPAPYDEQVHGRGYDPRREDPPTVLRRAVWEWAEVDTDHSWAAPFIADACSRREMSRRSGRSERACIAAIDSFRSWARLELGV